MHPGFIYVIRCHDTAKVGHSYQPQTRHLGLVQAHGLRKADLKLGETFPAQRPIERLVHKALARYRLHGEWYLDGPWIVPAIKAVLCKYNGPYNDLENALQRYVETPNHCIITITAADASSSL